jgi:hypothetical protein
MKGREISGSHGGKYEDDCLVECGAVQSYRRNWSTSQRCLTRIALMMEAVSTSEMSVHFYETSRKTAIFMSGCVSLFNYASAGAGSWNGSEWIHTNSTFQAMSNGSLTYGLPIWGSVHFQKLIVAQLVKKRTALYGTRGFTAASTRARHWTPSLTTWIRFTQLHFYKINCNTVLSSTSRSLKGSLPFMWDLRFSRQWRWRRCSSGLWRRVRRYHHFGETYCIHLQGHLQPYRWRQYVSPKRWYTPTSLHGVTAQNNNIVIFPSCFPTTILYAFLIFLMHKACPSHLIILESP